MASLGAVGVGNSAHLAVPVIWSARALAQISGSGAAAGALIIFSVRGAQAATARADGAGDWTLRSGLNDGTYWASEVGAARAWLVEVAGATVTVTPQAGGGGGSTIISGHAWAQIG